MFKLWDINNKDWVSSRDYVVKPSGGYAWRTREGILIGGSRHKLVRNTFIKDITDRNIYESDICNFKHNGEIQSGIVEYKNGAYMINGFMLYEKKNDLIKVSNAYEEGLW